MSITGITTSGDTGGYGLPVAVLSRDPLVPNPEPVAVTGNPASVPDARTVGSSSTAAPLPEEPGAPSTSGSRVRQNATSTFSGNFAALLTAVRSEDVPAAQRALSTLKSEGASAKTTYSPAGTTTSGASGTPALTALLEAVRHGSATGAKAALARLENDTVALHKNVRARGSHQHANRVTHRADS